MMIKDAPRQIVGVVADVKGRSGAGWTRGINALAAPAPPVMYVPVTQVSDQTISGVGSLMSWTVRTSTSNTATEGVLRRVVQASAPRLPFVRFETMHQVISRDIEMQQFLMALFTAFAAAAMALAGVGIYGMAAYNVEQRTREIGIRRRSGQRAASCCAASWRKVSRCARRSRGRHHRRSIHHRRLSTMIFG